MRIVSGQWRGRALIAPAGDATRPTADRVREALFSMLASRVGSLHGLRVLDGFAGTGALGLEALSRGAAHATFIECNADAIKALRSNIAALKAPADIIPVPIETIGPAHVPCDIILLDPPYLSGLGAIALERLGDRGWIAPGALISIETSRKEVLETPHVVLAVRNHGKARLHLLRADG